MKADPKDILIAKLFIKAAFPVLKVVIQEDPSIRKKWENVQAVVQFRAFDDEEPIVSHIVFDNLDLKVYMGEYQGKPDVEFTFSSINKMVTMLKGGPAIPDISSLLRSIFRKPALTINALMALMKLKLMLPTAKVEDDLSKYLKVKLSLYMITTALSTANKLGWDGIKEWTKQPDRIYQFIVGDPKEPQVACYLRVKGGNSKAGRGVYERKVPFVLFQFPNVDSALTILLKKKEFVQGAADKDVEVIGSPEYGMQINDIMAVLQEMLT